MAKYNEEFKLLVVQSYTDRRTTGL